MKTVIVLPTYNEGENIEAFINAVYSKFEEIESKLGFEMNILVVDDFSPDGTGEIVKRLMQTNPKINLLQNNERGLGRAYIRGFKYSIEKLDADIVMEMDSDFSHNPNNIIELLSKIKEGYDFVIGSRYVKGGSIPSDWPFLRKLNSYYGNIFARYIAGLKEVKDCTSGYRAIRTNLIKKIDLDNINASGYSFQMNLLYFCSINDAKIAESPINFIDREKGKSKLGLKDITEFMMNAFKLLAMRKFKTNPSLLKIT